MSTSALKFGDSHAIVLAAVDGEVDDDDFQRDPPVGTVVFDAENGQLRVKIADDGAVGDWGSVDITADT